MFINGAILILAGGQSRRMGFDKAQLPIASTTLLDWQRDRLAALGLPIWHSGPDGIEDEWPDFRGPLAGIYSAVQQQPGVAFWVLVPVDMPALPLSALRPLIESVQQTFRPVAYQDTPFPLAVPNTEAVVSALDLCLNRPGGRKSIRAFMTLSEGNWLPSPLTDDDTLNINTPDDWAEFLRTLGGSQ
ncbi:molybdenum cofactor guanylyltransferase [Saccharospirillum mangrovi]|uniref:molybdenum cofactor guanylyltransferase n=1 Tax=Saccharospirillum mangrovi TaxID=2161747 RepID=UPI000D3C6872|nr:molybdenum cofactor guanylyltransferase [Saccharospirillum mangrovi]